MTVLRHVRAASCASLLVVALAGCGGDPEPEFSPAPAVSPTASASAEVDEPKAWEKKSPEGAVAFAKHWTATFSEAFRTGETQDLVSLSGEDCETCETFIDLINEVYGDGGNISGEPWRFTQAGWVRAGEDVVVTGRMVIPEQVIERSGKTPAPAEPTADRYIFTVAWTSQGWETARLVREA